MREKQFIFKSIMFAFIALMLSIQATFAQNALTSVKINIQNIVISTDRKTISYDAYLQRVNKDTAVAVPGFLFRLAVPQADLGTNAKTVTVTNPSTELGAKLPTMTVSGTNWLMKFQNANLITAYADALLTSETFPGSRIGTFNITNTDGTSFANPQTFNATYAGNGATVKTTVSVFSPNTTTLAPNTSIAQPSTNFTGLGSFSLTTVTTSFTDVAARNFFLFPNPASNSFSMNLGNKVDVLNILDLNGKKVLSQLVSGNASVNISSLANGVYIVDVNGIHNKLVKK